MRKQSLNVVMVLALALSLIASIGAVHARAQSSGPPIENSQATPSSGNASGGPTVQVSANLGNNTQQPDYPQEIVIGTARYLFDRIVPLSPQDLNQIAQGQSLLVFAREQQEPFGMIYVSVPNRGSDELGRYLPEHSDDPAAACPAEAAAIGQLDAGGTSYAFAGYEPDLTADLLLEVANSNGQPVYADPSATQPYPELFVADPNGLLRFLILDGDGRPAELTDSLAFGGRESTFTADVSNQVDVNTLTKVGCAGPFPTYTGPDATGGSGTQLYALAGTHLFSFQGEGGTPEPASPPTSPDASASPPGSPGVAASPANEASPTVPPIETQSATAVPTETSAPTDVPTEVPTATEAPTSTPIPTEAPTATGMPTEAPTSTPIPTEAPTATGMPTEAPTSTPIPTEAPTATGVPTEAPTSTPIPTEAPTATGVPTEAPTATDVPQATAPAATSSAAPAPVLPTTTAATATATVTIRSDQASPSAAPVGTSQMAEEAGLPSRVEVEHTSYVFSQVAVDVDIQTLVQVSVIQVQGGDVTVYAAQKVAGVAPQLYCVKAGRDVTGLYLPVASTRPAPPPSLPAVVNVPGSTYVFNEVDVNVDIQTLVQVQVIVVQNVQVTIYADSNVQGVPPRLYAVVPGGQVVGQYVDASLLPAAVQAQPIPTAQLQPPAVVSTLLPNVPPPAASTAVPTNLCTGEAGAIDARGLPTHLPNRIQQSGIAYSFVRIDTLDAGGTLTRIGCIGPFEAVSTDQADRSQVIYLRATGQGASQQLYRFEAAVTFQVQIEVTGRPDLISSGDQPDEQYQLQQIWQPAIHASTTVILFVADLKEATPATFYAVNVHNTVVGEVIGEYQLQEESAQPSEAMVKAAGQAEMNPDLTVDGQRYLLVNIYTPVGTTTNGFVTLFAASQDGHADILLGRDKRRPELFVYRSNAPAPTGG